MCVSGASVGRQRAKRVWRYILSTPNLTFTKLETKKPEGVNVMASGVLLILVLTTLPVHMLRSLIQVNSSTSAPMFDKLLYFQLTSAIMLILIFKVLKKCIKNT